MTTLRLPRFLADNANVADVHDVAGSTVQGALAVLFDATPVLRGHLTDESGEIRPHVLFFVDGVQADLGTSVGAESEIRVIQAVSGG